MTQDERAHPEPEGDEPRPASDEELQDLAEDEGPDASELDDEPRLQPRRRGAEGPEGRLAPSAASE
jgi:hypothetical protein